MFTQINKGLYTCRGEGSRYRLTYGTIKSDGFMPWAGWRLDCIEYGVPARLAEFITETYGRSAESMIDYYKQHPRTENYVDATMHEILARAADMIKNYECANRI